MQRHLGFGSNRALFGGDVQHRAILLAPLLLALSTRGTVCMLSALTRPRRVVITGMGCVTPLGIGRETFWRALIAGQSGVRTIQAFDVSSFPVKIAAEIPNFDWEAQLN